MVKRIFTLPLVFTGLVPAAIFLLFDFNSYILSNFAIDGSPTPAAIYIPQQVVASDTTHEIKILILGGSSTREFFPMGSGLDATLSNVCGRPVHALNAGTSSQSLADSASIADAVYRAGARPDVIIVGMTKFRLSHTWSDWGDVIASQQLALPTSTVLLSKLNPIDAIGWWIHDRFNQVARIAPLLRSGKLANWDKVNPVRGVPNYDKQPIDNKIKLEQALIGHAFRNVDFLSYAKENAEYFATTFAAYAENGSKMVFLFTPISPVTRTLETEDAAQMQAVKAALATTGQVIDLSAYVGLDENMFFDQQHLRPEGRTQVWKTGAVSMRLRKALCGEQ